MTFEGSGTGTGIENSIPKIREREGNEKIHSRNSGRESEASILGNDREREGNGKNPFPKFGNGKGMEKIHSQSSGTGRE